MNLSYFVQAIHIFQVTEVVRYLLCAQGRMVPVKPKGTTMCIVRCEVRVEQHGVILCYLRFIRQLHAVIRGVTSNLELALCSGSVPPASV